MSDDPRGDADTIEWAAAEAAARGSELRIVHTFRWPRVLDPFGRTTASVAVIGLSDQTAVGPSAGRVVVGVDRGVDRGVEGDGTQQAVGFGFRAARRRGAGLTIVDATASDLEGAVRIWQLAYPEIDVRWRVTRGPVDSAVLTESAAAALTVLGPDRRGSASENVLRLARGPVILVGTTTV